MNTLTITLLERALERVRHGFPTFDGALKYRNAAPDDVWKELSELVLQARLEHDGSPDFVPGLPRSTPGTPRHARPELSPAFYRWRSALEDAHRCVAMRLPWEDAPGGGGLTRPQAVTVLSFALLLAQGGVKGLDVQPGEMEARERLRPRSLGERRQPSREPLTLGERFAASDGEE